MRLGWVGFTLQQPGSQAASSRQQVIHHAPWLVAVHVNDRGLAGVKVGEPAAAWKVPAQRCPDGGILGHAVIGAAPVEARLDDLDGGRAREAVGQVQGQSAAAAIAAAAVAAAAAAAAAALVHRGGLARPESVPKLPGPSEEPREPIEGEVGEVHPGADEEDDGRVGEAEGPDGAGDVGMGRWGWGGVMMRKVGRET
jgi:hypothetical protein